MTEKKDEFDKFVEEQMKIAEAEFKKRQMLKVKRLMKAVENKRNKNRNKRKAHKKHLRTKKY